MPTTYTDQFFLMDPANPPSTGSSLTYVNYTLTDQNDDNDFDSSDNDMINGVDITSSWPGDTITVNVPGVGNVTYTGVTFYLADGSRAFTPDDGQVLENGTFVSSSWVNTQGPLEVVDLGPPCFVAGTLIETARGMVCVEEIKVGDQVMTLDHGLQEVRWHGARNVVGVGDFAPIRFAPGAIGNERALLVSPQHRILITGWRAELFFGESEILVAATHLVNGDTINRVPARSVDYHHLMFDCHEIIMAEGIAAESFYPGDYILGQDDALRQEISTLFPDVLANDFSDWETARCVLRSREATVLCGDTLMVA